MTGDLERVTTELKPDEQQRRDTLESIIRDGLNTFRDVGEALAEIRDSGLYRSTHPTFAAYCREVWDLSKSHAYRMIEAARVADGLSPIGDSMTESQARELVGLEPRQAVEVYAHAVKVQPDGKPPTANAVRRARAEMNLAPPRRPRQAEPEPEPEPPHRELRAVLIQAMSDIAEWGDRLQADDVIADRNTPEVNRIDPTLIAGIKTELDNLRKRMRELAPVKRSRAKKTTEDAGE
jgi:hypothetical protein